jgi:hypothetical protein
MTDGAVRASDNFSRPKSCCCLPRSKDKPEDLGFPPVEPAAAKPADGKDKPKPDVLKQLVNNVLKNPFIWGMALTYFFIYIVRQVRTGVVIESENTEVKPVRHSQADREGAQGMQAMYECVCGGGGVQGGHSCVLKEGSWGQQVSSIGSFVLVVCE